MSLNAIIWALEQAPVDDPTTALVLIALADNANQDGTGSWPPLQTIAHRARCSVRTAQRHLRILEDARIIRQGNQDLVAGYPANRRPVVYDLNLAAARGDNLSPQAARGDTGGQSGVTPVVVRGDTVDHNTVLEPNPKQSIEHSPALFAVPSQPMTEPVESDGFEEFWDAYPRKIAKGDARKAWKSARKDGPAADIIAGAKRYAADPTRTPQYTAYPATWLRATRWQDDGPVGAQSPTMDKTAHHDHWQTGGTFT